MKIAVTQRVVKDPVTLEERDCLDQRWLKFMEQLNFILVPVPNGLNNVTSWASALQIDGVLLSGGNNLHYLGDLPDVSLERDITENLLLKWAESTSTSVFGVCRGFQMINYYLGGSIEPILGHSGTRHIIKTLTGKHEVNSYHNYAVTASTLAPSLCPTSWDLTDSIEAYEHKTLPWAAVMWHPERELVMTDYDRALLENHFTLAKDYK